MDDGDDEDDGNPSDDDYTPTKGGSTKAEKPQKETAKHSVEEELATAAQFSINMINLFDPPMDIHFGKWNQRLLKPTEWKKLKTAMTIQGIKAFTSDNMLPLVINRRHVDPSCIENKLNGYNAKTLVLSEDGNRELVKLEMAGGRHRLAAIQSIKDDKEKELKKLESQRDTVNKRRAMRPDAVQKKQKDLDGCNQIIAALEEEISKLGNWGVILYDEGTKQSTYTSVITTYCTPTGLTDKLKEDESEMLFKYLSQNLPVQRYVQTDGEALLQAIGIYVGYKKLGKENQAKKFAASCKEKNHLLNVNLSMPKVDGREYAMQLYKLEGHMGHTSAFTSKWINQNILGIYGGVSNEFDIDDD